MQSDLEAMAGDPFILLGKSIFHDLKEVFKQALFQDWNTNRQEYRKTSSSFDLPQTKGTSSCNEPAKSSVDITPKPDPLFSDSVHSLGNVSNTQSLHIPRVDEHIQVENVHIQGSIHPVLCPPPR